MLELAVHEKKREECLPCSPKVLFPNNGKEKVCSSEESKRKKQLVDGQSMGTRSRPVVTK